MVESRRSFAEKESTKQKKWGNLSSASYSGLSSKFFRTGMMASANEEVWLAVFKFGHPKLKSFHRLHRSLPPWELPRRECKLCYAPFEGLGAVLMRLQGKIPSVPNPDYCTACNRFIRAFPGGAEVELSILFIDVRGSGKIAAQLTPSDFGHLLQSFYKAATRSAIISEGFIIDLVGDALVAIWPSGFVGEDHARKARRPPRAINRNQED